MSAFYFILQEFFMFKPTYVFDKVGEITPDFLAKKHIKGLLLDLDNTLTTHNNPVPPQSSLALFYARLLPHIRGSVDDNKTTSVSEAFRVMGKKTVETLADESEREIKEAFLKSLGWSKYFRTHLDDEMMTVTGNVPLRKIVYTEKFTTSETEHRSTAVHKSCVKKVSEIVSQNKELIKSAEDFIPEYILARDGEVKPSILYKAFTGGRV